MHEKGCSCFNTVPFSVFEILPVILRNYLLKYKKMLQNQNKKTEDKGKKYEKGFTA